MDTNDSAPLEASNMWELKQTPPMLAFLSLAYTVVFTLSIIGNVVVIATVYRIPSMHTAINYFICNLSTADTLVAIFCLPLNLISSTFTNWMVGRTLCKALPYLQGVAVAASVTTLSFIAFDRFLAVCHPLRRHFSKKQSIVILACIWIYGLLLLLPWAFNYDTTIISPDNRTLYLWCVNNMSESVTQGYQIGVIFCLLYAAPLAFITACYGLVAAKLSRRTAQQEEFLRKSSTANDRRQMSRLVKMLVTVVLIFAISWLPLHLISVLFFSRTVRVYMESFGPALPSLVQWIGISNCCVNPWIYCAFSKSYRTNFLNTLRCRFVQPVTGSVLQRSCVQSPAPASHFAAAAGAAAAAPNLGSHPINNNRKSEQNMPLLAAKYSKIPRNKDDNQDADGTSGDCLSMVQLNAHRDDSDSICATADI
ncbi:hypothetical protein BOX15_Mlig029133g1 [Macrostomum lignano]|uniref:G-protein coupled receptors family 1 profile domain-containing protein n=1 Tax=Macrostomum lignano TaxID=282301 RepID=A0A267ETR1_9PLAT|nr:hypothetical protein BOX15_Mlig029133g1 [Macrostomum lignano]